MNKQKGQALIEFALVLPFFLLLVFSLIYTGMLFHDYSTLTNIARTAARDRAITENVETETLKGRYYDSASNKFKYSLVTDLYLPDKLNDQDAMSIDGPDDNGDIVVTIKMRLHESSPLMEMVLPETYSVIYHMRKDYN